MSDNDMIRWLRSAIAVVKTTTEEPYVTPEERRIMLGSVAADEAIIAEHTTDGFAGCQRCIMSISTSYDGCEQCGEDDFDGHESVSFYGGNCPTMKFLATRYRYVIPGWKGEWAS